MPNLALVDLVLPYVLRGENLGSQHAALSALRVVALETASDDFGVVLRGRCEFNGRLSVNPIAGGLRVNAGVDEAAPAFDPGRRSPVFDLREAKVDFELFVPRSGSAIVALGAQGIAAAGFANTRAVLDVWDTLPLDPDPSDYASSGFVLDLILTAPTVRPPFLQPAKLNALGLLDPDPAAGEVALTLPRLRFRLSQGNAVGSQLRFELVSAGAASLEDPADIGVVELISMNPPYAFIGGPTDRVVGIGFRSATLDLSAETTPPAILKKAAVGDDWTGLYLPEVRVFFAPQGARDLAFEAGARELLIGFGEGDGFWGDFEAALVNQGSGELALSARFIDAQGRAYGLETTGSGTATARVPEQTRLVVDVRGGRAPYTRRARIGAAAETESAVWVIDLAAVATQIVVLRATDSSATPLQATLAITVERRVATPTLPRPGPQPVPALPVALSAPADTPVIVMVSQNDTEAVLATEPRDSSIQWAVGAGAFGPPQTSITVGVTPGQTVQVRARKPGQVVPAELKAYFHFDLPEVVDQAQEASRLLAYARAGQNVSTVPAASRVPGVREAGHRNVVDAWLPYLRQGAGPIALQIRGHASYENLPGKLQHNYLLARRRAIALGELLQEGLGAALPGRSVSYTIDLTTMPPTGPSMDAWRLASGWESHVAPGDRVWWAAALTPPAGSTSDDDANATLNRPAAPPAPTPAPVVDPPVPQPRAPDWFRSARLKLRVVRSQLIAGELEAEIDIDTATEQSLRNTGTLPGGTSSPTFHTLQNGSPVGPSNPADGITKLRLLCQADPATGRVTTLASVGADPADKDGLGYFGWVPGQPPQAKDVPRTLLGSYLSFWPLLVEASNGGRGDVLDGVLTGAALVVPGVIAALPWFQVERIVLFGAEYQQRDRGPEFEAQLLFDIGIDWSVNILDGLIVVPQEHPLSVRYKAIGLRLGNRADDGSPQFVFKPIFDSARGFTIDIASGGALRIGDPLGQILRVLGARLSRSNPLTFEIDIGLGVDLGVVAVERASVRAYLDASPPRPPELTALQASVDIPGALAGSGYLEISNTVDGNGNKVSLIAGAIDLTLRPLQMRVAAALAIATINEAAPSNRTATGVYVGLNVVLPVGIPLGNSGLGIFGFRGIFGMHFERSTTIGASSGVPALAWLREAQGQPHLLTSPGGVKLWVPKIDKWSFGLGMLIGTMEGGVLMNLDGTLLLELPGPRVLIMMNARIVSPPPALGDMGMTAGILAVIEITPEHFLIGVLIQWDIERLVKIVIPVEAVFPFPPNLHKWHVYLGKRPDIADGQPVEVDVLGIVRGTGYLMFKGDGFLAYNVLKSQLPEIKGFGVGLGAAASYTWGSTALGLYVRVGGGFDAVVGFDPFIVAGTMYVSGELRLFIVSIGAYAQLTVKVNEQAGAQPGERGDLAVYVNGRVCGKVSFLFFDVEGCVEITVAGPERSSPMPALMNKVSLKSRSPALVESTGVDKGIDVSLCDAIERATMPSRTELDAALVPVDAIPVLDFKLLPDVAAGLTVQGLGTSVNPPPGLIAGPGGPYCERSGEKYRYTVAEVALERIDPGSGAVLSPAVQGSSAPVVWWTLREATGANANGQLALLTWEPTPATKAIHKSERLTETVRDRWGTVCRDAAPPAEVLWTFRWEPYGPSPTGWVLEGVPWPDPIGTRRSAAPPTALRVSERWRSGDETLDVRRGIVPAFVVGGFVACWPGQDGGGFGGLVGGGDLVGRGPTVPRLLVGGRGGIEERRGNGMAVDVKDVVHAAFVKRGDALPLRISPALYAKVASSLALARARRGDALGTLLQTGPGGAAGGFDPARLATLARQLTDTRLLDQGADTPPALTGRAAAARQCEVRVLQAPILDDGRPIVLGDASQAEALAQRLKALGVSHGPLDNVVVLGSGAFDHFNLLLLATSRQLEERRIVVRWLAADGSELGRRVVSHADRVPPTALPARWTQASGPWVDDIDEILRYATERKLLAAFVQLKDGKEVDRIEIGTLHQEPPRDGLLPADQKQLEPPFFVGAASSVMLAEVLRASWDSQQITSDRQAITDVLGPASSDGALLFADATYRVRVRWSGERLALDGNGQPRLENNVPVLNGSVGSTTQNFWFRTDRIEAPSGEPPRPSFNRLEPVPTPRNPGATQLQPAPVKLDPWVLTTLPAQHEPHVFYAEPTRIVFNTHDVDRFFAAYGQELRVRFQAASSRHPAGSGAAPHPLPVSSPFLVPLKAAILSPWEEAAGEVLAGSCIPVDESRVRHGTLDIPIPLEAYTDYILDVEMVPQGAAATARGPSIYRRHFATGGYATLGGLAATLGSCNPTARACGAGVMAALAAQFAGRDPQGGELDDALRARGIEPLGAPDAPRVLVFWSQTGNDPPQPEAVLLDASAPLWRSRPYPKSIVETTDGLSLSRNVLAAQEWLQLQDASAAGVLRAQGLVKAPGLQRALFVLAPGARGKVLAVDLVSLAFPQPYLNFAEQRHRVLQITFDRAPWEET